MISANDKERATQLAREFVANQDMRAQVRVQLAITGRQKLADLIDEAVIVSRAFLELERESAALAERVKELETEVTRLSKDPGDVLSDHPGCVYCMEAGTPVGDGEVCPKCGDRLPTKTERRLEQRLREFEAKLAERT